MRENHRFFSLPLTVTNASCCGATGPDSTEHEIAQEKYSSLLCVAMVLLGVAWCLL